MIVTHADEASAAAERFRQYINTPVLTRIKLNTGSFKAYDIEPATVPDMMSERPIMIFGKYKGKPTGTVTLTGKVGRKSYKQSFDLSQVKPDKGNAALRYLWARERIKYLDYQVESNESPEAKAILELGLKYNLMTNYTSFIAIDEQVVNKNGKQVTVQQPIPMPEGVSDYAVGHDVAEMVVTKMAAVGVNRQNLSRVVEEDEEFEEEVFVVVEEDPEFPGGMKAMLAFIEKNLVYPEEAKASGIEGKVYVSFTVEKDGSISNVKILRDIGYGCGDEVVRIVKLMPKWNPGKQRGVPVRVRYNLPVQFILNKQ